MFHVLRNPTDAEIVALIRRSKHKAARTITDPATGDKLVWDAAHATHQECADALGIAYDRPPGAGDIITI